jgi:HAD superfamily phosphatase (TIGR01668 family)
MPFSLIPRLRLGRVTALTPAFLRERGVRLLLLDLDNTLAPYSGPGPTPELFAWKEALLAGGVTPFIVSNTKTERAKRFAALWGVDYVDGAGKPRRRGIETALRRCGAKPEEAALAGDQIFTDVLGANRAGVLSVVTHPLELKNPFYILRYAAELPFRAAGRVPRQL